MNDKQTLTLKMIVVVLGVLKNTDRTSGVVGLPARLTQLGAQTDEINALGEAQLRPTQAQTARRNVALQIMQDAALDVGAAVAIYATDAHLPDLARTVKISDGDFTAARVLHRPWLATRIADAAEGVLTHLAPHVTPETLADLRTKISDAETAVAQPRSTIEAKASATRRLAAVFGEAKETLTQIDRLLFPLRKTDPDFYADYRSARRVVDLPNPPMVSGAPTGPIVTNAPSATMETPSHAATEGEVKRAA